MVVGELLRDKGGFLSPTIRRIEWHGRPAVLKDYGTRNLITRRVLAPTLVRREFRILRHLEGVSGIPRAYAVVDGPGLITEFIEGRHIHKLRPDELSDAMYRQLAETIAVMHARGVVHLDLRQRKNVIISDRPYLVDFTNAVLVQPRSPLRAFFTHLGRIDETGLLKWKARHWRHLLTEADRKVLREHRTLRSLWIFSPHTDREKDRVW